MRTGPLATNGSAKSGPSLGSEMPSIERSGDRKSLAVPEGRAWMLARLATDLLPTISCGQMRDLSRFGRWTLTGREAHSPGGDDPRRRSCLFYLR
jgi:hypothetical protein